MKKSSSIKRNWYVVFAGARPGIYGCWEEVERLAINFPKARYQKFSSRKEAEAAFAECSRVGYDSKATYQWNYTPPVRRGMR